MSAAMIRQAFALTPPFWWPVLVISILSMHHEMNRAEAAGFTHGRVWLLQRGRLWLELAQPIPALPPMPPPAPHRLALMRALCGDTAAQPVTVRFRRAAHHAQPGVARHPRKCAAALAGATPDHAPDTS